MNANEENMTPTQAAGYIVGVVFGFVRRHHKTFAILLALGGLSLILIGARLEITPVRFAAKFDEGALLGVAMIAISIVLWFMFRTPRK
jgi:hypothetical protein